MGPEHIRIANGFLSPLRPLALSLPALLAAAPALAQGVTASTVMGAAPLAVALGAAAFGLIAIAFIRRQLSDARAARQRAATQVARLRALVDEYEGLLSGPREMVILWTDNATGPRLLGQPAALLPAGRLPEAVLDFADWLEPHSADGVAQAIEGLRVSGRSFELTLAARDGRAIRASGWVLGNGTALRLRPAAVDAPAAPVVQRENGAAIRPLLQAMDRPAFLRDVAGRPVFGNAAYLQLTAALGLGGTAERPPELLALRGQSGGRVDLGRPGPFDIVATPVPGGTAVELRPVEPPARDAGLNHLGAIIEALATPIAIFNPARELVQCNRAYTELWGLERDWLRPGLDERAILDRLRTDGKLPNDPDYQGWRARHLKSYHLKTPTELDPWHLPNGHTVSVIAAPAGPKGGVIYVFEDITDQLTLKSQHQALLDVQRSTLNALSEAVAVFGTNGRLTLSNPRLSQVWKLPANLLKEHPHIDQLAEAAAQALPEDGAAIWRGLKKLIVDLNPTRSDQQGRLTRADGKLIDYAITRLPDGQSMMTFLDVTESANYQRVLKEKNEALLTADRLKDAFVQNVSYELRSPLTNIIGFADLLAAGTYGPLNDRQKSYTDYIRASSVTLGVLIDNILDLANVDAGIAELRPETQDVAALVEKARAGVMATFPAIDGEPALRLDISISPSLPVFVADGTRIVQVLYNLLSNAARFSEPGGLVRLSVGARGEDRMVFVVEDEGAPMSEDMRRAMLDQAGIATAGRQRAAGLGLAIVRSFVNMHGGTIAIEKREPRGTRVIVNLPADVALAGAAE